VRTAFWSIINIIHSACSLGCHVTAFDRRAINVSDLTSSSDQTARILATQGDLTAEASVAAAFEAASAKFGPPNILVANAGITDESKHPPVWEVDTQTWDKVRMAVTLHSAPVLAD